MTDTTADTAPAALVMTSLPTLEAGARQLDRMAAAIPQARSFLLRYGEVRRYYTSELFSRTLRLHDAVVPRVVTALEEIGEATTDVAARLRATRDIYAHTAPTALVDPAALETLWSSAGREPGGPPIRPAPPGTDRPATVLTDVVGAAPAVLHPMPDLFDGALCLADYIDSSLVGEHGTWLVFGQDPVADVAAKSLGDWADIAIAGAALTRVARFCERYTSALNERVAALRAGWGDPLAQGCLNLLADLVEKVRWLTSIGDELGQGYQRLATTVWEANTTVADGITTVLDRYLVPATGPREPALAAAGSASSMPVASPPAERLTADAVVTWRAVSSGFARACETAGHVVDQLGTASFRLGATTPSYLLSPAR